jgi:site-specific DNA-methyltransferase (adenine-specific)
MGGVTIGKYQGGNQDYSGSGATNPLGRWPANFIHDGSEEATDLLGASARFFYCAKASKADRGENHHPTVKPTDLMRYLCRLVTPPSGIVLDPFMGSGSTGKAAMLEGFAFVGIEREAEYIDIAKARIQSAVGLL